MPSLNNLYVGLSDLYSYALGLRELAYKAVGVETRKVPIEMVQRLMGLGWAWSTDTDADNPDGYLWIFGLTAEGGEDR